MKQESCLDTEHVYMTLIIQRQQGRVLRPDDTEKGQNYNSSPNTVKLLQHRRLKIRKWNKVYKNSILSVSLTTEWVGGTRVSRCCLKWKPPEGRGASRALSSVTFWPTFPTERSACCCNLWASAAQQLWKTASLSWSGPENGGGLLKVLSEHTDLNYALSTAA